MRPLIVAGNWKMNGDGAFAADMVHALASHINQHPNRQCVLLPSFVHLSTLAELIEGTGIQLGAQNVAATEKGAFTGEVSAAMLQEVGCRYVLIGHSERRSLFHESEEQLLQKFKLAKAHNLIPVLCVGETLEDREQGITQQVIEKQLEAVLNDIALLDNALVAYEPVWAIGTGKTATPQEAQDVHAFIREKIGTYDKAIAEALPILYGGSVNASNAATLFAETDIDGGLVGGASLKIDEFVEILTCTI